MWTTVEKTWSERLGIDDLRAPGVRVVRDVPGFEDRIFLLRLGAGLTIVAPARIDLDVSGRTPDELFTPDGARSLGEGLVLGPSWHGYADAKSFVPQAPCDARRVEDAGDFHVDTAEWAEGGFGAEPDHWYASFDAGERVAMGNMTDFNGAAGDVGLVTHPDHRGKGHATRLAGAMIADALEGMEVVRYRALFTNLASMSVARKLGFEGDGANIVVRLVGGEF